MAYVKIFISSIIKMKPYLFSIQIVQFFVQLHEYLLSSDLWIETDNLNILFLINKQNQ